MENIKLFFKGIIIGIGKIIPGVSGSILAIMLGLYDKGLEAINNMKSKENFLFLTFTGSGILISIVYGSSFIIYLLEKWYFGIMLLFCGLIFGTIPIIKKEVKLKSKKEKVIFVNLTLFLFLFSSINVNSNYEFTYTCKDFFYFMLTGFIEASTMIIPGISGTAILMILGVYQTIMETFSHLFSFSYLSYNIRILFPFALGFLLGFFLVTKCLYYFIKKNKEKTYFMIFIFAFSSFLLLLKKTFTCSFTLNEFLIGIVLFILGYYFSSKLEEKQ